MRVSHTWRNHWFLERCKAPLSRSENETSTGHSALSFWKVTSSYNALPGLSSEFSTSKCSRVSPPCRGLRTELRGEVTDRWGVQG